VSKFHCFALPSTVFLGSFIGRQQQQQDKYTFWSNKPKSQVLVSSAGFAILDAAKYYAKGITIFVI
jgi:hypothetical protein